MRTTRFRLLQGSLLVAGVLLAAGPAMALGVTNSIGWQGNGSRIIDTGTPSGYLPLTVVREDISSSVNATTGVSYSASGVGASAQTSDYTYNGTISATGYSAPWRAGGYTRDELYFESSDGQAASLEFVFNVNATAEMLGSGGSTALTMSWAYWDGLSWTPLSSQSLLSISGDSGTTSYSGTASMAMTDVDAANLFESGTYLPYSIGVWGDVINASASWDNMVSLADVLVRDAAGNVLDPENYLLRTTSGSLTFASFENPPAPAAVPIPSSLLLLSTALAGVAGIRRQVG